MLELRKTLGLHFWAPLGAALLLLVLWAPTALADGTESLGDPTITIDAGTGVLAAGVGLNDAQPGNIEVEVPDGATVEQVILYWGGDNFPPPPAVPDATDTVTVTGSSGTFAVVGDFIGGNTQYAPDEVTVSYRADITDLDLVDPGSNTIAVEGLDFGQEQYGAGVLVIIADGSSDTVIDIRDGNDYAHIRNSGDLQVTDPQTFSFPAAAFDRVAQIDLLVGSVADDTGRLGFRPSSIEMRINGKITTFDNELNSEEGRFWDVVTLDAPVEAGDTEVTVELFSRREQGFDGYTCTGGVENECPASLVWIAAGLSIEEPLCVLGDLVWLDDGDGIQELDEPGIANVELSLTSSCDDSLLEVTSTDSEGFYLFDDLACDCTYTVTVNESSPALDGLDQTLVEQGDDDCLDSNGVEAMTTLTPSDPEDLCLDFGFVEPIIEKEGCRWTGGLNDTFDTGDGVNIYTGGGQAGASTALQPQPKGEWTHTQRRGPAGRFTFHGGTASAPEGTEIDEIRCSDPGTCKPSGDPPSPLKQLDFDGIGTFRSIGKSNGQVPDFVLAGANATAQGRGNQDFDGTFHWFEVNIDDDGEPGNSNPNKNPDDVDPGLCPPNGFGEKGDQELANCGCSDFYRITIYDGVNAADVVKNPDGSIDPSMLNRVDVIYQVRGYINGGNLQIHRLTGFDLKQAP